jgi:hypothetical protein
MCALSLDQVLLFIGATWRLLSGYSWRCSYQILESIAEPGPPADCVSILQARGSYLGAGANID